MQRFLVWLALAAGLAACRPSPTSAPDEASPQAQVRRLEAHLQRHPQDDAARLDLALLRWGHLGEREAARADLAALAERGVDEARLVQLIMAEAELDREAVERHAYALLDALAARDGGDPPMHRVAAAEFAARHLTAYVEGDPTREARFLAFYGRLDLAALPYGVRQPLVSERAAIARRRGEPYREFFAQEGCVHTWEATEVLGRLGVAELQALPEAPFSADPQAKFVPLACAVRLWNPTPRAGIRRLRTYVQATEPRLHLDVESESPSIVMLDGVPIGRSDETRYFVPRRHRLEVEVTPGWHQLEIAVAVPAERTWVLVRAMQPNGQPASTQTAPPPSLAPAFAGGVRSLDPTFARELPARSRLAHAPLRDFMAADRALAGHDSDQAEIHAERLAHYAAFAEGQLMRARFERADPSRPQAISAARERQALRAALARAPELDAARLRLLELRLDRGEHDEVVAALADAPPKVLHGLDGEMFRFRAQRARGNEHLALEALERARSRYPGHCAVLLAELAVVRDRQDVRREDALAAELAQCNGSLPLRAELAEKRGRTAEAIALWNEVLARVPDDVQALENLARLTESHGGPAQALDYWGRVLAFHPLRASAGLRTVDLQAVHADEQDARTRMLALLRDLPHSDALRQAAETLGIPDDLLQHRVDGLQVRDAYLASGVSYEGVSEVLVLDRSVARVYANGGQRHIVHLLVHLMSKDALDRYGQVEVPESARLLTLRSIKPDGTILEPEVVSGKDGVELRHLEVGDFVDYEFILEEPPQPELGDYVDVTAFRFQSLDIPYHRSELLVVFPSEMPLRVERRQNAPVEEVQTRTSETGEELTLWHFRADEIPRLGVEPGHRSLLDELPNVRVYAAPDRTAWIARLAAGLRPAQRSNPALRRLARALVRGQDDDTARFTALWRWVVEHIEEGGDVTTPATVTLAGRRGNRMMLLHALARSVGLRTDLWLVRNAYGPAPRPDGHPMFETFDTPILAAHLGDAAPVLAMTASEVMPIGYLPPGFAEAEALPIPLDPDTDVRPTRTPSLAPALRDARDWKLAFVLDPGGSARVDGELELRGMEAIRWRQALRDIDRDRVQELFTSSELGWLRGATLERLEIHDEHALERPLRLVFTATAEGVAIRQGDAWVLRSAWVPLNVAERYAALPERKTGLLIPYAPDQTAEIRMRLQKGAFEAVPPPLALSSPYGTFRRDVQSDGREVTLRYATTLRTGVVEPEAYPQLAAFAHQVDVAMQATLRASPGTP